MLEGLLPEPSELEKRISLLEKLKRIVHARWPEAAVEVYAFPHFCQSVDHIPSRFFAHTGRR
jgi:DNA polymerase sigma